MSDFLSLVCSGELGGVFLDDAHCSNVNSNDEKSLPEFTPPPRGRRATLGGRDLTAHCICNILYAVHCYRLTCIIVKTYVLQRLIALFRIFVIYTLDACNENLSGSIIYMAHIR